MFCNCCKLKKHFDLAKDKKMVIPMDLVIVADRLIHGNETRKLTGNSPWMPFKIFFGKTNIH
jgi:hypothetical protein